MKDDALRRNFVRRLNYYMDANKLTQADLARHMGVCTHLLAILLAQKKEGTPQSGCPFERGKRYENEVSI